MTRSLGWLASYPKSGNTWLRFLLESLLDGGAPVDINDHRMRSGVARAADLEELFGIEASELTEAEVTAAIPDFHRAVAADADRPLIFRKTHDRYWRTAAGEPAFPGDVSRGAVYIVRDPRDIAVSYAHHRGRSIDDVIAFMADESFMLAEWGRPHCRPQLPQPLGSWSGHVASWLEQTGMPVLLLRYEDMHADPLKALAAAARHLGLEPPPHAVAAAVDAARFDRLSAQEIAKGFNERPAQASAPFFRSGRPGGWRTRLTPFQADRIVADHGAVMARMGYLDCGPDHEGPHPGVPA